MQRLIIKIALGFCYGSCVGLCLNAVANPHDVPQSSYTLNLDLKESSGAINETELEDFFTRLKINYPLLKPHLDIESLQAQNAFQFIQVYDRPNDDPHQNEKVRNDLGLTEKEAFAYSTARMILIMSFVPQNSEQYEVHIQWLAQMMVGTHTDSASNCHIEFRDKKYPLSIAYPSREVTRYSDTKLKKYSVIIAPRFKVATFSTQEDKLIEGSLPIKRGDHLHYKVDYQIKTVEGKIQNLLFSTSNHNPLYAQTDAYLVGSKTPNEVYLRLSPFVDRPEEEIKTIEITGDGAEKLGQIFKKNKCISCHGVDGKGGEKFNEETGVPLDPSDLWHSLGHLISTYGDDEREYIVNYTYADKWPSKMNTQLLEMLNNEEDRNYLREWLSRNKTPLLTKNP